MSLFICCSLLYPRLEDLEGLTPLMGRLITAVYKTPTEFHRACRAYSIAHIPGLIISSGLIHLSKSSAFTRPSASAASFSVMPSACAFLAIVAALS